MARGKGKGRAVSGPGALSQRTDLTPQAQPSRVATGGPYGQRKTLEAQQAGAPLASNPPAASSLPSRPAALPSTPNGIFGPTARPDQSGLTGASLPGIPGSSVLPEDPDMMLRAMYSIAPNPYLLRLLQRR